jgi:crotonobetainyl-CoA:carnitine CoA-transferase CaiB-like acyl-CoA transferase
MMSCGERGGPPAQILPGIGDELGGLICAWGITAALYAREKTGKGQVVDTSLMGSMIATLGLILAAPAILGQEFPRELRAKAGNPIYNHYRCQDDKWIALAHLQPDRYWPNVCRALDICELQNDPKFNTIEARAKHARELVAILDEKFATKTRDEWLQILKREDCICTPIQSPIEVVNDLQASANNYFISVDHPAWGTTKVIGFPWDFSETPASWRREAPEFGQHTEEILLELGYTWEDITHFKEEGATI